MLLVFKCQLLSFFGCTKSELHRVLPHRLGYTRRPSLPVWQLPRSHGMV